MGKSVTVGAFAGRDRNTHNQSVIAADSYEGVKMIPSAALPFRLVEMDRYEKAGREAMK